MPEIRISRSPRRSNARIHWRSARHPPGTQAPGTLRGSLILILIYVLRGSPIPGRQAPPTSALLPCYLIGDNESPAQSRSPLPLAGVTRSGLQLSSRPQDVPPSIPEGMKATRVHPAAQIKDHQLATPYVFFFCMRSFLRVSNFDMPLFHFFISTRYSVRI